MPIPAPPKKTFPNRFFKALEILNRTNSATMGAANALFGGNLSPLEAARQGITGETLFGGQDLVSTLTGSPVDSKLSRRAGLAADFLNPLDPLNYIGFGALTKAGRTAKLLKGIDNTKALAGTIGNQARQGQRALVKFDAPFLPELAIGGAPVLDVLGKGGGVLRETGAAKGLRKLFGGRVGQLAGEAGVSAEAADALLQAKGRAASSKGLVENTLFPIVNRIKKLIPREEDQRRLLELGDQVGKTLDVDQFVQRFTGAGKGATNRQKATREALELFRKQKEVEGKTLQGTGPGRFILGDLFFPARAKRGGEGVLPSATEGLGGVTIGPKIDLVGHADNPLNRHLLSASEQPVTAANLQPEGIQELLNLAEVKAPGSPAARKSAVQAGVDKLVETAETDPLVISRFLQRHKLPIAALNRIARNEGIMEFEDNAVNVWKAMVKDMADSVEVDSMMQDLLGGGIAKTWDDAIHAVGNDFIKIDQGRWAQAPLALPAEYARAFEKFQEVFHATPQQPFIGKIINETLGLDLGALGWWKGFAIYGGGPFSYWSRNFSTAVMKNNYEGINPITDLLPGGKGYYKQALEIMKDTLPHRLDLEGVGPAAEKLRDKFFTTKTGHRISYAKIIDEYQNRAFHGGGGPDPEIFELGESVGNRISQASKALREKTFKRAHNGNHRVEMMARIPLMLKYLDDTYSAAAQAGRKLDLKHIGADDLIPMRSIEDVAFTNAREAVIRAHFDYTNLSAGEKQLRQFIPFYTWMRRNIPNEAINLVQNSGKYMPFARALVNAHEQQQISPEDLPTWAQRGFALPIAPTAEGETQWLDFTGFLPFMDLVELGTAVGTGAGVLNRPANFAAGLFGRTAPNLPAIEPEPGKTPQSELLRYIMIRSNPLISQTAEQTLQRNAFTRRGFGQDTPNTLLGLTVGSDVANFANVFRPIKEIDRLNLFNMFGGPEDPRRAHRNEPQQRQRLIRLFSGIKGFSTDQDNASLSQNARAKSKKRLQRSMQRARRAGDKGLEIFYRQALDRLEQGL